MVNSITTDGIREQFSRTMSAICQQEVPQYGTLLELVADVNLAVLENNPQLHEKVASADELAQLNIERRGTIRVGTTQELATLRRMFVTMGMYPMSCYDLPQVGMPVHSTAFRPIGDASLVHDPFRVFTSLFRLEFIENEILRQKAAEILRQRDISTPRCRQLLEEYERRDGFNETQAQEFAQGAPEAFHWHQSAAVDEETYHALYNENRLVADVVCFPGRHIDHLTPRTLDIDRVQSMMPERGVEPKVLIEGSPHREVSVLLHQASFKALEETVLFAGQRQGAHTVRFGGIEQRGVALTPKRRQLHDDLLWNAGTGQDNLIHRMYLQETFRTFPDGESLTCRQRLGWFRYRLTPSGEARRQMIHPGDGPQPLIERGWIVAQPITYENFLSVSAAGIFQSNLGNETRVCNRGDTSREAFEQTLGYPVLDEFQLYQEAEERSKRRCGLL